MIAATEVTSRTPQQIADEMGLVRHEIDMLELCFSDLAAQLAATELHAEEGSASAIDWIRHRCNLTHGAAADRVKVGQLMEQLPESLRSLAGGEIGFAHLTAMARTAGVVGEVFNERPLLEKARKSSPGKFYYDCRHYRHAVDPNGFEGEQAQLTEDRFLELSSWIDGSMHINGVLDPIGGAALRTALEPLARRSGEHDHRHSGQRMADALVELASGAGNRVHMQVTTSLETLRGLPGSSAAEIEFTLPISATSVERLACDCTLTRVLLDGESLVIDVGRSKRVVDGAARRALKARDGGCRWPGCDRPAWQSAAHHVVHWARGGTTDLDNLVLLCHRHHRNVHEGGWQLVRGGDGQLMTVPPTISFGPPVARGPD